MHPHSTDLPLPRVNNLAVITDLDRATERFWGHVDKSGDCWLWTAATKQGYGAFTVKLAGKHRSVDAHRFSYLLAHGSIPSGQHICHRCDVTYPVLDITYRRCVNPDHLWAGTSGDNARDAWRKGRLPQAALWRIHPDVVAAYPRAAAVGELNRQAKLTALQAAEIRTRYARGGITQVQLAAEYGVNQPHISRILRRASWRHV